MALAVKKRGLIFDIGHGGGSFDYTIAEAAIAQGCPPDTISRDVHGALSRSMAPFFLLVKLHQDNHDFHN